MIGLTQHYQGVLKLDIDKHTKTIIHLGTSLYDIYYFHIFKHVIYVQERILVTIKQFSRLFHGSYQNHSLPVLSFVLTVCRERRIGNFEARFNMAAPIYSITQNFDA
jgi:uncharacterized protein (DUF608 family)